MRKWLWKLLAVLILLLIVQLFIGWYNDHASCVRGNGVRVAFQALSKIEYKAGLISLNRAGVDIGATRTLDIQLAHTRLKEAQQLNTPTLNCSTVFPDVNKTSKQSQTKGAP